MKFIKGGSGDENIGHVDEYLSCSDKVLEGVVHHSLKGGGGITKAEEHNQRFKHPMIGLKSGLPFVAFLNSDVVVSPSDVELTKDICILQFVRYVRNEGEGILVFDGEVVELAVVLNRAQLAVFLFDEEEW